MGRALKEKDIVAALKKCPNAVVVADLLGRQNVFFVWKIARSNRISLVPATEEKGRRTNTKFVRETFIDRPSATLSRLAKRTGVCQTTVVSALKKEGFSSEARRILKAIDKKPCPGGVTMWADNAGCSVDTVLELLIKNEALICRVRTTSMRRQKLHAGLKNLAPLRLRQFGGAYQGLYSTNRNPA